VVALLTLIDTQEFWPDSDTPPPPELSTFGRHTAVKVKVKNRDGNEEDLRIPKPFRQDREMT
jgi:hypothetical protein